MSLPGCLPKPGQRSVPPGSSASSLAAAARAGGPAAPECPWGSSRTRCSRSTPAGRGAPPVPAPRQLGIARPRPGRWGWCAAPSALNVARRVGAAAALVSVPVPGPPPPSPQLPSSQPVPQPVPPVSRAAGGRRPLAVTRWSGSGSAPARPRPPVARGTRAGSSRAAAASIPPSIPPSFPPCRRQQRSGARTRTPRRHAPSRSAPAAAAAARPGPAPRLPSRAGQLRAPRPGPLPQPALPQQRHLLAAATAPPPPADPAPAPGRLQLHLPPGGHRRLLPGRGRASAPPARRASLCLSLPLGVPSLYGDRANVPLTLPPRPCPVRGRLYPPCPAPHPALPAALCRPCRPGRSRSLAGGVTFLPLPTPAPFPAAEGTRGCGALAPALPGLPERLPALPAASSAGGWLQSRDARPWASDGAASGSGLGRGEGGRG